MGQGRCFVNRVGPCQLNMTSRTSANTANTDSGLKRTLASSDAQHVHDLQPPTKKTKKETKLDKQKAEQKSEANNLKTNIGAVLNFIKGKGVANETSLEAYVLTCDDILAGMELDQVALQLFEMPFKDHFQPDETLHPAFATFVHDVKSIPLDEWVPEDDINKVSLALCQVMGHGFMDETPRRTELTKQLRSLGLGLQDEFHIERTPPLETHSVRPDLCLSVRDTAVLLGAAKSGVETGSPYIQVCRANKTLF